MGFVDLSHVIEPGTVTYPGLPGPDISSHLSFEDSRAHYSAGTEFTIGRIDMVTNTGTYLDTPAHRFRDGADLHRLPLESCAALPAVVLDGDGAIGPEALEGVEVEGCAVLLRTGWDRHWGTERYGDPDHPHLTGAGARHLVDRGAALVGIDSVNIDDTRAGERPPCWPPAHRSSSTSPAWTRCRGPEPGSPRCPRRCGGWARSRCGPSRSSREPWAVGTAGVRASASTEPGAGIGGAGAARWS